MTKDKGQFKFGGFINDPDDITVSVVGSKQTEQPQMEKQGSLLDWGEDVERLEAWKDANASRNPEEQEGNNG